MHKEMIEEMVAKMKADNEAWNSGRSCLICGVSDGNLPTRKDSHEECAERKEKLYNESFEQREHQLWVDRCIDQNDRFACFCCVPLRHSVCTIENFVGDTTESLKWLELKNGENLLIQSERSGNGKTHLAVGVLKAFAQSSVYPKRIKPLFVQFFDMIQFIKKAFDDKNTEISEDEAIGFFSNVDLLVIDDIGSEKISEYSASILYSILNNRYSSMLPTIVTTNENSATLTEKYGSRIVSRIASGVVQKIVGGDNRISKAIIHKEPNSECVQNTIKKRYIDSRRVDVGYFKARFY